MRMASSDKPAGDASATTLSSAGFKVAVASAVRAHARFTKASAAVRSTAGTSSLSHWFQALLASTLSREEGISQSVALHHAHAHT
jgi:hypothetical protein